MSQRKRLGVTAVTFLWCVLAGSVGLHAQESETPLPENDLQTLKQENQQLREQVVALTAELEALRRELAGLRDDNAELTQETQVLEQKTIELKAVAQATAKDADVVEQAERITTSRDPESDQTTATYGPELLDVEGSAGTFYFSMVYRQTTPPHQTLAGAQTPATAVDTAAFFIHTHRAGRLFEGREAVEFFVDGQALRLPVAGYDIKARRSGQPGRSRSDRSDETVRLTVDRQTLEQLGDARDVTVKAGRAVLTFDPDDLAGVRAVAQRMAGQ